MSYEEHSRTEQGKKNGSQLKGEELAQYISNIVSNSIASDIRRKETDKRKKEREDRLGRGKDIGELIKEGMTDRFNAIPYDPNKYQDEKKQQAYYDGFYENGNRLIYSHLETLTDEMLKKIGANDYISGVEPDKIFPKVKENNAYAEGYLMASIFSDERKKHR